MSFSDLTKTIELLKVAGHEIVHKNLIDTDKIISAHYIISSAEATKVKRNTPAVIITFLIFSTSSLMVLQ